MFVLPCHISNTNLTYPGCMSDISSPSTNLSSTIISTNLPSAIISTITFACLIPTLFSHLVPTWLARPDPTFQLTCRVLPTTPPTFHPYKFETWKIRGRP